LSPAFLDRLFDRSEPLIEPWLSRGPGSGAIFRCIDCSVADPNPPAIGSCHTRLFKLSGYRPPRELSESFFWRARSALDVLNAAKADPGERAKAARLWAELFRVVHAERDETSTERGKRIARIDKLAALALNAAKADPDECARAMRLWFELYRVVWRQRDETGNERAERIERIDKLAAVAGLSPILFHLREFRLRPFRRQKLVKRLPARAGAPALAVLRGDTVATQAPLTPQSDGSNANNLLNSLVPVAGV
jgi:VanZ family protein